MARTFLPPFAYAKGGIPTVRASVSSSSSVTVGANIEGGVLGEKCLMESIGIGSRYCQRNRFGGPREHRYAPFEGVVSFFVWEFNFITDLLRNGERYKILTWT